MLTIEEVQNITFRKANIGGYKVEDVEAFLGEIEETLEQNKNEKLDLIHKLDVLAKRIEEYRKDEEEVKGALINAEKLKIEVLNQAQVQADKIISDANREAQDIIINANVSIVNQKNGYLKLQADAVVLREHLIEVYNNHIKMLQELPTAEELSKIKENLDNEFPVNEDVVVAQEVAPKEVEKVLEMTQEVVDISEINEAENSDTENKTN